MAKKQLPMIRIDDKISLHALNISHLEDILEIEELSFPLPWSRESYVNELRDNPLAHFLGLFWQDRLVAFGGVWLIMDEGHIANVAVHPLFRGQGLGELMMRKLMFYTHLQGMTKMTLEVRESNFLAQDLYHKLGFSSAGLRPGYYTDNGEAAMIMWCNLSSFIEKQKE
ncbi:MAG: ribosomal protein S18-alanine N-acetyltransferase [Bacillota bacterium]|jgi:ribosomal-protein-alanine N-acetyltransferase